MSEAEQPRATASGVKRHPDAAADERPRSVFVGRADQLAVLNEALAQATTGRGRVVMLVGDAGIGKTRTAAEFAAQARATGALVLRGGCYEGEWAPPYGPVAEALTAYVRNAEPAQLRDELGVGTAPLTRLLPALRERLPGHPRAGGAAARRRTLSSVRRGEPVPHRHREASGRSASAR